MTHRRAFLLKSAAAAAGICSPGGVPARAGAHGKPRIPGVKLSCNLYSFNDPLRSGEMSLEEVIDFCSALDFHAVDPTGYYFPGYPDPPDDEYVYRIKKHAFLRGLDISGTGVRTDFTVSDETARDADVALVERWVQVAAKMDAPVLRVFAGHSAEPGDREAEVFDQLVNSLRDCVDHGRENGVMIVLQNHNGFLKTADQVLRVLEEVDSDWFGLNLDIGSLRTGDPYEEILRLAPHAYTWQIKEHVYRGERKERTDLRRIAEIVRTVEYRGYLPLETLPPGDPRVQLPRFLEEVRRAVS